MADALAYHTASPIRYVPVWIEDRLFVLTLSDDRAIEVARRVAPGDCATIWVAPHPLTGAARDVLETAGYALDAPHGRAR